jgi:heme-degrading monooxygenase HmoA
MIARVWHGVTLETLADEFQEYILATGFPELKSTPGNLGVVLLRRAENGKAHFLLTSFWESFEAISKFAGPEIERARYYPGDEKYLIELEPMVTHYKVVAGRETILS